MPRLAARSTLAALVPSLALGLLAACTDRSQPLAPVPPATATALRGQAASTDLWAQRIEEGRLDGSRVGVYVPNDWNGEIVYYAHGIIDPALPVALPTGDDIVATRDALGALGYAVAYSSWRENGYAFADGVERTRELRELVKDRIHPPRREYLMGHSLGAQVVQALAEADGKPYDGALALCGVLGGTRRQVQYIGHVRALFDVLYPGWFPNTGVMSTPAVPPAQIQQMVLTALATRGTQNFGILTMIDQGKLAGRNANELVTTLINVLAYHSRGVNDFLARTNGEPLFDNDETVYTSPVPQLAPVLQAVNGGVERIDATPFANLWLDRNYEPTGRLRIPMLTMHMTHDRLVPFAHETAYRAIVDGAGHGALLRQRVVDDYGHCGFGTTATVAALQDLVQWVAEVKAED